MVGTRRPPRHLAEGGGRADRKGGRQTPHGDKINLATGRNGLVLVVVVESGDPANGACCLQIFRLHC